MTATAKVTANITQAKCNLLDENRVPKRVTPALLGRGLRVWRQETRPPSIPGSRLRGGALDNHADAAPRRPRTTGRTTGRDNRRQSPHRSVVRPTAVPTAPTECCPPRVGGPAGTRPRGAHREPLPSRLVADPSTRRATQAPIHRG